MIDLDTRTLDTLKADRAAQAADRLSLGARWTDEGLCSPGEPTSSVKGRRPAVRAIRTVFYVSSRPV